MPAGTAVIDHELARDLARHFGAGVFLDQRQGQVDAGGHAGGGPDRSVDDEDAVFLHADRGIRAPEPGGVNPVGGSPAAIQQPSLGEMEGARAGGADAPRAGRCILQERDQTGRRRLDIVVAHHQQGVERAVAERLRSDAEACRGGHRPALLRQQVDLVERFGRGEIGELQDAGDA